MSEDENEEKTRQRKASSSKSKSKHHHHHHHSHKHKKKKKKKKNQTHNRYLFQATLFTLCRLAGVLASAVLILIYRDRGDKIGWYGMVAVFFWSALTSMVWDWLNHGRCRYMLLDVLHLRVAMDYYDYYQEYKSHYGTNWKEKHFQQHHVFEAFPESYAMLVLQFGVLLKNNKKVDTHYAEIAGIIVFVVIACLDLFNYLSYVRIPRSVFFITFLKGVANTFLRTFCVALLLNYLYYWSMPLIFGSYVLGIVMYVFSVRHRKRLNRDDPIKHWKIHCVYTHQVASSMMLAAFPFAPSHSIRDWWYGYLLAETKLTVENTIMVIGILNTEVVADIEELQFISAVAFTGMCVLMNFSLLVLLHSKVSAHLIKRDVYSAAPIVRLFSYLCSSLRTNLKDTKEARIAGKALMMQPMTQSGGSLQRMSSVHGLNKVSSPQGTKTIVESASVFKGTS